MPDFDIDQQFAIRQAIREWLVIRLEWDRERLTALLNGNMPIVYQLLADVDHSALLHRLLSGKPPLPTPPPRRYSYPDYESGEVLELVDGEVRCRECGTVVLSGRVDQDTESAMVLKGAADHRACHAQS